MKHNWKDFSTITHIQNQRIFFSNKEQIGRPEAAAASTAAAAVARAATMMSSFIKLKISSSLQISRTLSTLWPLREFKQWRNAMKFLPVAECTAAAEGAHWAETNQHFF